MGGLIYKRFVENWFYFSKVTFLKSLIFKITNLKKKKWDFFIKWLIFKEKIWFCKKLLILIKNKDFVPIINEDSILLISRPFCINIAIDNILLLWIFRAISWFPRTCNKYRNALCPILLYFLVISRSQGKVPCWYNFCYL